eukprot:gb/GECH01012959.1/.p1 GENE.gb/GECH01012959.1/~~gb/GECH01012959.1/.p1  ORF type:complete len:1750 (+),score=478.91 gb/GECH01012959.1/:1-5250(+)
MTHNNSKDSEYKKIVQELKEWHAANQGYDSSERYTPSPDDINDIEKDQPQSNLILSRHDSLSRSFHLPSSSSMKRSQSDEKINELHGEGNAPGRLNTQSSFYRRLEGMMITSPPDMGVPPSSQQNNPSPERPSPPELPESVERSCRTLSKHQNLNNETEPSSSTENIPPSSNGAYEIEMQDLHEPPTNQKLQDSSPSVNNPKKTRFKISKPSKKSTIIGTSIVGICLFFTIAAILSISLPLTLIDPRGNPQDAFDSVLNDMIQNGVATLSEESIQNPQVIDRLTNALDANETVRLELDQAQILEDGSANMLSHSNIWKNIFQRTPLINSLNSPQEEGDEDNDENSLEESNNSLSQLLNKAPDIDSMISEIQKAKNKFTSKIIQGVMDEPLLNVEGVPATFILFFSEDEEEFSPENVQVLIFIEVGPEWSLSDAPYLDVDVPEMLQDVMLSGNTTIAISTEDYYKPSNDDDQEDIEPLYKSGFSFYFDTHVGFASPLNDIQKFIDVDFSRLNPRAVGYIPVGDTNRTEQVSMYIDAARFRIVDTVDIEATGVLVHIEDFANPFVRLESMFKFGLKDSDELIEFRASGLFESEAESLELEGELVRGWTPIDTEKMSIGFIPPTYMNALFSGGTFESINVEATLSVIVDENEYNANVYGIIRNSSFAVVAGNISVADIPQLISDLAPGDVAIDLSSIEFDGNIDVGLSNFEEETEVKGIFLRNGFNFMAEDVYIGPNTYGSGPEVISSEIFVSPFTLNILIPVFSGNTWKVDFYASRVSFSEYVTLRDIRFIAGNEGENTNLEVETYVIASTPQDDTIRFRVGGGFEGNDGGSKVTLQGQLIEWKNPFGCDWISIPDGYLHALFDSTTDPATKEFGFNATFEFYFNSINSFGSSAIYNPNHFHRFKLPNQNLHSYRSFIHRNSTNYSNFYRDYNYLSSLNQYNNDALSLSLLNTQENNNDPFRITIEGELGNGKFAVGSQNIDINDLTGPFLGDLFQGNVSVLLTNYEHSSPILERDAGAGLNVYTENIKIVSPEVESVLEFINLNEIPDWSFYALVPIGIGEKWIIRLDVDYEFEIGDFFNLRDPYLEFIMTPKKSVQLEVGASGTLEFFNNEFDIDLKGQYKKENRVSMLILSATLSDWNAPFGADWLRFEDMSLTGRFSSRSIGLIVEVTTAFNFSSVTLPSVKGELRAEGTDVLVSIQGIQIDDLLSIVCELAFPDQDCPNPLGSINIENLEMGIAMSSKTIRRRLPRSVERYSSILAEGLPDDFFILADGMTIYVTVTLQDSGLFSDLKGWMEDLIPEFVTLGVRLPVPALSKSVSPADFSLYFQVGGFDIDEYARFEYFEVNGKPLALEVELVVEFRLSIDALGSSDLLFYLSGSVGQSGQVGFEGSMLGTIERPFGIPDSSISDLAATIEIQISYPPFPTALGFAGTFELFGYTLEFLAYGAIPDTASLYPVAFLVSSPDPIYFDFPFKLFNKYIDSDFQFPTSVIERIGWGLDKFETRFIPINEFQIGNILYDAGIGFELEFQVPLGISFCVEAKIDLPFITGNLLPDLTLSFSFTGASINEELGNFVDDALDFLETLEDSEVLSWFNDILEDISKLKDEIPFELRKLALNDFSALDFVREQALPDLELEIAVFGEVHEYSLRDFNVFDEFNAGSVIDAFQIDDFPECIIDKNCGNGRVCMHSSSSSVGGWRCVTEDYCEDRGLQAVPEIGCWDSSFLDDLGILGDILGVIGEGIDEIGDAIGL